jgi:hypothetical protein
VSDLEDDLDEFDDEDELDAEEIGLEEPEEELSELSKEFVKVLVDKIMQFMELLVGHELHNYQKPLARRVIESVIINDGEEVTEWAIKRYGKNPNK